MKKEIIGNATLYQGDCYAILPQLRAQLPECAAVQCVLTDPPYAATRNDWDVPIDLVELKTLLSGLVAKRGPIVLFSQQPFTTTLISAWQDWFRYEWIFRKAYPTRYLDANRMPLRMHEFICIFCQQGLPPYFPQMNEGRPYKKTRHSNSPNYDSVPRTSTTNPGSRYPTTWLEIPYEQNFFGGARYHPTQKSVNLCTYLLKTYTQSGDIILDPFMGSGTTGVAALRLGRKFIGIEQEPEYFDIACKRVEEAQHSMSLFDISHGFTDRPEQLRLINNS